jgi:hypothetical protein
MAAGPKLVPDELPGATKKLALKTLSVYTLPKLFVVRSAIPELIRVFLEIGHNYFTSLQSESNLRKDYSNDE